VCGECSADTHCQDGQCLPGACVPICDGEDCGDDGCNGTCGACALGKSCVADAAGKHHCQSDLAPDPKPVAATPPSGGCRALRSTCAAWASVMLLWLWRRRVSLRLF
jgi:hypothetical protein